MGWVNLSRAPRHYQNISGKKKEVLNLLKMITEFVKMILVWYLGGEESSVFPNYHISRLRSGLILKIVRHGPRTNMRVSKFQCEKMSAIMVGRRKKILILDGLKQS